MLVLETLDTHAAASLCERCAARRFQQFTKRLEILYTPNHGSLLNMAEIELSIMLGQCLERWILDIETTRIENAARDCNCRRTLID